MERGWESRRSLGAVDASDASRRQIRAARSGAHPVPVDGDNLDALTDLEGRGGCGRVLLKATSAWLKSMVFINYGRSAPPNLTTVNKMVPVAARRVALARVAADRGVAATWKCSIAPSVRAPRLRRDAAHTAAAAGNQQCPPAALAAAAAHIDANTKSATAAELNAVTAVENLSCPPAALAAAAVLGSYPTRTKIARNPACPPAALAALSTVPDLDLARLCAAHPNTGPGTLSRLAVNTDAVLRALVLDNPNCPPRLSERLATH